MNRIHKITYCYLLMHIHIIYLNIFFLFTLSNRWYMNLLYINIYVYIIVVAPSNETYLFRLVYKTCFINKYLCVRCDELIYNEIKVKILYSSVTFFPTLFLSQSYVIICILYNLGAPCAILLNR